MIRDDDRSLDATRSLLRHREVLTQENLAKIDGKLVQEYVRILVPVAVSNLGSDDNEIVADGLRLIQQLMETKDPDSDIVTGTLRTIVEKGICNQSHNTSNEAMKLLPGIYADFIEVSI